MKKELKILAALLLAGVISSSLNAQAEPATDSLQRKLMRDSLHVTDAAITSVFEIRNKFQEKSAQITADSLLKEEQKNTALAALAAETNTGIRNVLGPAVYEQYTQMIRRRMMNRAGQNRNRVLASGGSQ